MKFQIIYFFLVSFFIFLSGCDSMIYEGKDELNKSDIGQKVFLSINNLQVSGKATINEDASAFEDRIHDLALLIFDSSTGAKIGEYIEEDIPFVAKYKNIVATLTTGTRDFYFVANMPISNLRSINSSNEMIAYLNNFQNLSTNLYQGATVNEAFPMSRVYLNQTVTEGGNIYSPKPFYPVVDNVVESQVNLMRVVAKLEIVIEGTTNTSGVKNIYYKNAYQQFSLHPNRIPTTINYKEDKLLTKVGNSYIYYIPEALMMDTNPVWSTTNHKPINYFLIETLDGTTYEVPIITDNSVITDSDYMNYAMGLHTNKPDYNIYRNRHYYYLMKNLQSVQVLYTIDPWVTKKTTAFMGYGYNVEVTEAGVVRLSNTVLVCDPHHVTIKTINGCTFSDKSLVKDFVKKDPTDKENYTLVNIPETGKYLEIYYNGLLVKTFEK